MTQNDKRTEKNLSGTEPAQRISSLIQYAAYPTGTLVAALVGDVAVRTNVYKNIARRGAFSGDIIVNPKSLQEEEQALAQKVMFEALEPLEHKHRPSKQFCDRYKIAHKHPGYENIKIEAVLDETAIAGKNASARLSNLINNDYRRKVRYFFEDLGMHNLWDYTNVITRNQRIESAIMAMTAAAITVGSMLYIADHKALTALVDKSKRDNTERAK